MNFRFQTIAIHIATGTQSQHVHNRHFLRNQSLLMHDVNHYNTIVTVYLPQTCMHWSRSMEFDPVLMMHALIVARHGSHT